tara:strand:- start:84611 stop:85633 length:1023 start_codon:yes stop_codon:yes gene_type:complete
MSAEPDLSASPTSKHLTEEVQYGFYDRLTAEFPSQVVIDSTELCNLACTHCPHPDFKKTDHYQGRNLDTELNRKVVDEIATAGKGICQYIRYTGEGEPLIHPGIFDMVSYAVQNSGTTVTITTNGTLNQGGKLEKLIETGVDIIDISVDAFNSETYAAIRVNGDLTVTRDNVLRLLKMAREPGCTTKVIVSYVEQPRNQSETADFEKFWKDKGADYVVIRRLHTNAGSLVELAESIRETPQEEARRPCLYPWERITLNPRGELSFCPVDWVHGSAVADFRKTTIKDVWQGEFYKQLREAHLSNNYAQHKFCGQCPDWQQTRWPSEGRSYADMVQDFKNRE